MTAPDFARLASGPPSGPPPRERRRAPDCARARGPGALGSTRPYPAGGAAPPGGPERARGSAGAPLCAEPAARRQARRRRLASIACRVLVAGFVALAAGPRQSAAQPPLGPGSPFSPADVATLAADLAQRPFVAPSDSLPPEWANLNYDQYRDIRFRRSRAVWHGEGRNFELQLLPAGWLYKSPVEIYLVDNGRARRIEP